MNRRIPKGSRGATTFHDIIKADRAEDRGKRQWSQQQHWKVVPGDTFCLGCEENFATAQEATVHRMLCVEDKPKDRHLAQRRLDEMTRDMRRQLREVVRHLDQVWYQPIFSSDLHVPVPKKSDETP